MTEILEIFSLLLNTDKFQKCQIDNKKAANLFQTYCFHWPHRWRLVFSFENSFHIGMINGELLRYVFKRKQFLLEYIPQNMQSLYLSQCSIYICLLYTSTFQRPPATRWTGIFQNFFRFCNPDSRILATGGAENFSFHSLHHRALKFAKRNGLFSLCFLLRTKIKNAKHRGKKFLPHLLLQSEQGKMAGNGAGQQKKQQIFFRLTASAGRRWRLVFSFQ